jgi:hypothetical protein
VIDFLANLFDWSEILRIQSQMQDTMNARMASFAGTIAEQRPKVAARLQSVKTSIANAEASGATHSIPSLPIPKEIASLGGQFGFLMDKVSSYMTGTVFLNRIGLGSLQPIVDAFSHCAAADISALSSAFLASPLYTLLREPSQLPSLLPQQMLAMCKPLVSLGLSIVSAVADAVLAAAPALLSGIQTVIQQRLTIPVLTDLIELVVFQNKQQLTLQSLLTLMAAALYHVLKTLFGSGPLSFGEPMSFSDSPAAVVLPCLSALCNYIPGMTAGAFSIYANTKANEDFVGWLGGILGLISAVISVPVFVSSSSYLSEEQWVNWALNLMASIAGLVDTIAENETAQNVSATCAFFMAAGAISADSSAISGSHGDRNLAGIDMGAQLAGALNNLVPKIPEGGKLPVTAVANLAAAEIGIAGVLYASSNPDATLG